MAEVFVSYSQNDRDLVAPIAAGLAELGVDTWIDRDLSPGDSYAPILRARLSEAKAVLVCWSPQAIKSEWVEAEADFARATGNYVPVYIVPCTLLPPFNRHHTDNLSKWAGSTTDPDWLRVIDRVAKLIGREGVAAAARAIVSTDEQTRYNFAQRYPDEPTAARIWLAAEARHWEAFKKRMAEAREAASVRINAERARLDARLAAVPPAFEAWLAKEKRGAASGQEPDPLAIVEQQDTSEVGTLHEEIARLSSVLAKDRASDRELKAAKAEVERLSERVAEESSEAQRLRDEIATLRDAQMEEKAKDRDLNAAKARIEQLSEKLASLTSQGPVEHTGRGEEQRSGEKSATAARQRLLPRGSLLEILFAISLSLFIYTGLIALLGWYEIYSIAGVVPVLCILLLIPAALAILRSSSRSPNVVRLIFISIFGFIVPQLFFSLNTISSNSLIYIFRSNLAFILVISFGSTLPLGWLILRRHFDDKRQSEIERAP